MNSRPHKPDKVICPVCGLELPATLKKCPQDGVALNGQVPVDPLVGTVIAGRYEIIALVGRGGMSVVYKARNRAVGSIVAIKTLKQDLVSDEELFARFCQEAKAVQLLTHPHIVTMHEFGVMLNGQPFIAMDYLEGITLADAIEETGRLPVKRTLKIFIQVCDALSHAHQHKIIHRDIKPGNIMLINTANDTDVVKLFDFGFAKMMPQRGMAAQQITQHGDVLGTPLYMSPEQSRGKPLDSRSDIYSVGCVMYEALTGSAPLVGENVLDTMQRQINDRPKSLASARPDLFIPDQVATILFKTLEKDVANRYQSMNDLKRDLEILSSGLSGKAAMMQGALPGLSKLVPIPEDKSNLMPTAGIFFLVVLIAGAIAWNVMQFTTPSSNPQPASLPVFSGEPIEVWSKYRQAGILAMQRGNFAEAEDLMSLSLKAAEKTDQPESHMATTLVDLARVYITEEKLSDAEKAARKALTLRQQLHQTNDRTVADLYSCFAEICLRRDDFVNADSYLQKALAIQQRELGPAHQDVATTLNGLGQAAEGRAQLTRAENYYKQALVLREQALGPNKLPVAETLTNYSRLLRKMKKTTEANKAADRAASIRAMKH